MKILGISGKKQSGKNSTANYIVGKILKDNNIIHDFNITEDGELSILTDLSDGTKTWGTIDLCSRDPEFLDAADNMIFPFTKNYSFADSLKQAAVDLFELKPEQVWGTDEQKNTLTHLKWEDMPGITTYDNYMEYFHCVGISRERFNEVTGNKIHKSGLMTAREFLQFFGTEIGRKMHGPIWINATINKILEEQTGLAVITDVRFPDEVEAIKKAGGKVFRLSRTMFEDGHPSELSLDKDVFDWNNFDAVIKNQEQSLKDTCAEMARLVELHKLV